jgi:sensor histidine kinase YesM
MLVLDHYLEIQRIRFGRRFTFQTDISESVRTALIPSLMMQPLVENAIRHGIYGAEERLSVPEIDQNHRPLGLRRSWRRRPRNLSPRRRLGVG